MTPDEPPSVCKHGLGYERCAWCSPRYRRQYGPGRVVPEPANDPPFVRPGPPSIDPGRCPGGVVMRVYAIPSNTLVIEQCLTADGDLDAAAEMAAALMLPGWAACLVAYDGDTGERAGPLEWGISVG